MTRLVFLFIVYGFYIDALLAGQLIETSPVEVPVQALPQPSNPPNGDKHQPISNVADVEPQNSIELSLFVRLINKGYSKEEANAAILQLRKQLQESSKGGEPHE